MASSFPDQIPVVVHLLQKLQPSTLLDVGKGLGKYGFLAHEYAGLRLDQAPDPSKTVAAQSRLQTDAVEVERTFLWPHLSHFYRRVYVGKIEELYPTLPRYDVVLMADVIEHLTKEDGARIVSHFLKQGSRVVISTPKRFFEQHLYNSPYEEHISHWPPRDLARLAPFVDYQNVGAGRIFLLSPIEQRIRGFGNRPIARARRLARLILAEFT